jgi:hypothetical protein
MKLSRFRRRKSFPRVVINQSKEGYTARLQSRHLLLFWKTAETKQTFKEFDDVLVNLGVTYFEYIERNRKKLGYSRQVVRQKAGRFGKKVVRKSVGS